MSLFQYTNVFILAVIAETQTAPIANQILDDIYNSLHCCYDSFNSQLEIAGKKLHLHLCIEQGGSSPDCPASLKQWIKCSNVPWSV